MMAAAVGLIHVQDDGTWMSEIDAGGWTYIGRTPDISTAVYIRPSLGRPSQGNPRVWARLEYRPPGAGGFLSAQVMMEVNCADGTAKYGPGSSFRQRNLGGEPTSNPAVSPWSPIAPGSIAGMAYASVCKQN
jgi:hypothetical protein